MSKTIEVIDLLNKIANGEIPSEIKYKNRIYKYDSNEKDYMHEDVFNCYDYLIGNNFKDLDNLNDTVEIIEEQEEIDIQSIKELEPLEDYEVDKTDVRLNRELINKILQWAKQLDKKIKEER